MRSRTNSLAVMLLLACTTSAHKHHGHHQRLSSQFSENYDHQNMLQLYSHMAEFDYTEEYADNDISDFVQVETKGEGGGTARAAPTPVKEKAPDEKTIINQLKKQTPAEIQQENEREKQVKQEEQAFAQPFLELGQSTEEYQQKQHQKKREIKNLLKQAVEGKTALPPKPASKPATATKPKKVQENQIKLFQEDNVINEDQEKIEKLAEEKQQLAAAPKPKEAQKIKQPKAAAPAPKETQAVPSTANTSDLFEQSQKLLSATENLDNGKEVVVPKPLSNPKQIAQEIIKKHQMEMQAVAQKEKKQETEKDEFSQNLYEMSKQLLNSANEIEKETERSNAIRMQKEAEDQATAQRAYDLKVEAEKKLKKQQKKEKKTKAMHDLEKVTAKEAEKKVEAVVQKHPEPERVASPTDPEIMKAAEAAASAIVANEKAMKQKEEDSHPKSVLDEISKMVVSRTDEVEKGPKEKAEQAKIQQLAIAQEQTKYTPLQPSLMQQILRPNFQLNNEQQKAMAEAEKTSNSFLDRLNNVQTSPFSALDNIASNPFDGKTEKSKSDEQDMHQQIIKLQDASLQMFGTDINA